MSISPDFSIWVIEDDLGDTVDYYLEPLEKIAGEIAPALPGVAFPKVKVLPLALDPNQRRDYLALRDRIRQRKAYPVTRPHLYLDQNFETSTDEFFGFLKDELDEKDVLLVDPTARGSGWWPESEEPDNDKALYFIFKELRGWKGDGDKGRVLLVSHVPKISDRYAKEWGETEEVRVPKMRKDPEGYRNLLREKLEPFIYPETDWTESLNSDGRNALVPFVEKLRASAEGRRALRQNVGQCAALAMLQVLTPSEKCARDLVEATGVNSTYYRDPLSGHGQEATPLNFGNAKYYRVLIRRRALYGLRRLWKEFARPKSLRNNDVAYKLWLEVVAGGYRWYVDEYLAIAGIYDRMKERRLTLGRNGSVNLADAGLNYRRKDSEVKTARLEGRPEDFRYEEGHERFLRFFQGSISFIVPGEKVGAPGQGDKAKAHFEIKYKGHPVPEDNSPRKAWDAFWKKSDVERDFLPPIRHGHIEKIQQELSHRCCFKDVNAMVLFQSPMPEEIEWWKTHREQFGSWLQQLAKQEPGFAPFDPGKQCG